MICPHCREGMSYFDHGVCSACRKYCGCSFNPTSRNDYCTLHWIGDDGAARLLLHVINKLIAGAELDREGWRGKSSSKILDELYEEMGRGNNKTGEVP
jgi:hypothetical protein